jgi:hypothetical protein
MGEPGFFICINKEVKPIPESMTDREQMERQVAEKFGITMHEADGTISFSPPPKGITDALVTARLALAEEKKKNDELLTVARQSLARENIVCEELTALRAESAEKDERIKGLDRRLAESYAERVKAQSALAALCESREKELREFAEWITKNEIGGLVWNGRTPQKMVSAFLASKSQENKEGI